MPTDVDFKRTIETNLNEFQSKSFKESSLQLLNTLGYSSDKRITLEPNTAEGFKTFLKKNHIANLNEDKAHLEEWQSVDFLFQLTDSEIGSVQSLFDSSKVDVSDKRIESYLFFAIELKNQEYRRSVLAEITREINRVFPMPALILFKHGETLTFSIIDRRLNKKDATRDVLLKVTLIKDIRLASPHRAHLDIISELSFTSLKVKNFVELHHAWQNILNISTLNKKFYKRIVEWFNEAVVEIKLPSLPSNSETHKEFAIRLIARLVFVWFLKELGVVNQSLLVPNDLIRPKQSGSNYYKYVLQNLFFNALNKEHGERIDSIADFDIHGGSNFENSTKIIEYIAKCPFLNGGLFDEERNDWVVRGGVNNAFSVPDDLLIGEAGLNSILSDYKFTTTENTPSGRRNRC